MFIKKLKLVNFRNFSKLDFDFSKITLLVGKNAQGKSNLLEAIYFLATTKSPRAEKDLQLIKEGTENVWVKGDLENGSDLTKLEIALQIKPKSLSGNNGLDKRVKVNGVARRTLDYIGNLAVIHFGPEDINLVTGPPALRRWHIDLTLAQVDREYKVALTSYHESLAARNKILKRIKDGLSKTSELDFWTQTLIQTGTVIYEKRRYFFQVLNQEINLLSNQVGLSDQFSLLYQSSIISENRVREYLPREVAAGITLIGAHRDDFIFKWNNNDLAYFGSRGEQRTATLEFKLAELKFIKNIKDILPVLLLDDVFSELDETHRDQVAQIIGGQQTIISTVETTQLPKHFLKSAQIVQVEKGEIYLK